MEEYRQLSERFQVEKTSRVGVDVQQTTLAKVFVQRWEDNQLTRPPAKPIYCAHPAEAPAEGSKWTHLQKKINTLKAENNELKRSLNFAQL